MILILVSVFPLAVGSVIFYTQAISGLDDMVEENLKKSVTTTNYFLEQKTNEALSLAQRYARNEEFISHFIKEDRGSLDQIIVPIYNALSEERGVSVFEFGDEKGIVFTRGHHTGKFGDDKSGHKEIQTALSGQEVKGISIGKSGLAVRAYVPIIKDNKTIGTFQVGFGDQVLQDIRNLITGNISLYENDTLSLTSDDERSSQIGQPIEDSSISEQVLSGKEVKIVRNKYVDFYYPLYDFTGETVQGMIQISEDITPIIQMKKDLMFKIMLIFVVTVMIACLTALILANKIAKPISMVANRLQSVAAGDLKGDKLVSNSTDEVGDLIASINQMIENFRHLIKQVTDTTHQIAVSSEELTASAEQTNQASEHIASNIEQMATGVEHQVRGIQETSAIIDEMTVSLSQVAINIQQVSQSSVENLEKTAAGSKSIQTAEKQMNSIHQNVNGLSEVIIGLGERSREIGQILDVITGIAAQTNLLALNAAIEAARAGEHGRGFSVVADEVRKLAEQSAKSAQQISHLITQIQEEMNKAVFSMDNVTQEVTHGMNVVTEAGESFIQIQEAMNQATVQFEQVSSAIQKMNEGANRVVHSIQANSKVVEESASASQSISASTEEQVASMQEISASAHSLSEIVDELQLITAKFKV